MQDFKELQSNWSIDDWSHLCSGFAIYFVVFDGFLYGFVSYGCFKISFMLTKVLVKLIWSSGINIIYYITCFPFV